MDTDINMFSKVLEMKSVALMIVFLIKSAIVVSVLDYFNSVELLTSKPDPEISSKFVLLVYSRIVK